MMKKKNRQNDEDGSDEKKKLKQSRKDGNKVKESKMDENLNDGNGEDEPKKKKLSEVEDEWQEWLKSNSEYKVQLISHKRGILNMAIGHEAEKFSIKYIKNPNLSFTFNTKSQKLKEWINNINEAMGGDISLKDALTYAMTIKEDFEEVGDFEEIGDDHVFVVEIKDEMFLEEDIKDANLKKKWKEKEESFKKEQDKIEKDKNEEKVVQIFTQEAASNLLINELLYIMKSSQELGYIAEPIEDNIYHWNVKIFDFGKSDMARELEELNENYAYNFVEFTVFFKIGLYPFYPPLLRMIRPRFQGYIIGRITAELKYLKLEYWDPTKKMVDIIGQVREILMGGAVLDAKHEMNNIVSYPDGSYTKLEYKLNEMETLTDTPPRIALKFVSKKKVKILEEEEKGKEEKTKEEVKSKEYWAKGTGYGFHGSSGKSLEYKCLCSSSKRTRYTK